MVESGPGIGIDIGSVLFLSVGSDLVDSFGLENVRCSDCSDCADCSNWFDCYDCSDLSGYSDCSDSSKCSGFSDCSHCLNGSYSLWLPCSDSVSGFYFCW